MTVCFQAFPLVKKGADRWVRFLVGVAQKSFEGTPVKRKAIHSRMMGQSRSGNFCLTVDAKGSGDSKVWR
jgi:hypothetical protein